jgi:hypothetical protein
VSPSSHKQGLTPPSRRFTWHKHIFTKRKQLGITLTKVHWLLGLKSKQSTNNKILIYKTILKPIWTYGIQLWGTASTSNIEILERFQSKTLRIITDAPWYVPNETIRKDLQISDVASHHSTQHNKRLSTYPNEPTLNLQEPPWKRPLQRHVPISLSIRFDM